MVSADEKLLQKHYINIYNILILRTKSLNYLNPYSQWSPKHQKSVIAGMLHFLTIANYKPSYGIIPIC